MLLKQVVHGAEAAQGVHGAFEPTLLGWIVLLPLLGFLINGVVAIYHSRLNAPPLLPAPGASEEELHADLHDAHPATDVHPEHPEPTRGPLHDVPSFVGPGVMLAAFGLALWNFFGMVRGDVHEPIVRTYFSWMPVGTLQVDAALLLDPLSMLMTLVITGVGFLIHVFSVGYMRQDPGYPRYFAYLNLFVFFMLVLVLGSSYPLMFVGWEGVGLASYLLIGFWFREKANADAGKKAFIVNRIGDFGFLIGMFLLWANLGTLNYLEVFEAAPVMLALGGAVVTVATLFLFLGATGKSAQIPLYIWLPDAMAGPTPVSALIHAATMVTAGVYMIARSSVLFTMAPLTSLIVALVGAATALFAATIGVKQWDIKKVLAYSTVSQLGFMIAAVGMGAYVAGVFHLMTHAFFKACLFLGAGAVIHAMHHALHATHNHADAQDMRNMGGLVRWMPITFGVMLVSTFAIAGIPPFSGFFSKDEIIGAAWIGGAGELPMAGLLQQVGIAPALWFNLIGVMLSVAAVLTAFYMGRMMIYTFLGANRTGEVERDHLHEVGPLMWIPLVLLAILATVGGFFNIDSHIPVVAAFMPVAPLFGGELALHHWLHPVLVGTEEVQRQALGEILEPHHSLWPILLAIGIGVGGLAAAWFIARPERLRTAEEYPAYQRPLGKWVYNKWYVDEAYGLLVVRPLYALSRGFSSVVDRGAIDGFIDGGGRLIARLGLFFGRVQTGHVNTYAFVIVVGVIVVVGAVTGVFNGLLAL
jgi:NADH-quinone oxidoreductase subunit L